jgi:hypothetical protein
MSARRYLIVNADDFGLGPGVNEGIIIAHARVERCFWVEAVGEQLRAFLFKNASENIR